ncbi:MAG: hypothetical protein ACFFD4_18960 [Candidatus Odinarchaeota archaeon]
MEILSSFYETVQVGLQNVVILLSYIILHSYAVAGSSNYNTLAGITTCSISILSSKIIRRELRSMTALLIIVGLVVITGAITTEQN